ncbi:MAG: EMC3/TMCO1 family protein [Nitrososphaerota archaeon]
MDSNTLSMLLIIITAILLISLTNFIRKSIIKKQDMEKMMEANLFRQELMKAKRRGDQKTIQKLEKRMDYIKKVEFEVMKKNFTVMIISMALFLGAYWAMAMSFGDTKVPLPGDFFIPFITQEGALTFYGWYILAFFAVSLPLSKAFGLSMTGGGLDEKSPQDKKQEKKAG